MQGNRIRFIKESTLVNEQGTSLSRIVRGLKLLNTGRRPDMYLYGTQFYRAGPPGIEKNWRDCGKKRGTCFYKRERFAIFTSGHLLPQIGRGRVEHSPVITSDTASNERCMSLPDGGGSDTLSQRPAITLGSSHENYSPPDHRPRRWHRRRRLGRRAQARGRCSYHRRGPYRRRPHRRRQAVFTSKALVAGRPGCCGPFSSASGPMSRCGSANGCGKPPFGRAGAGRSNTPSAASISPSGTCSARSAINPSPALLGGRYRDKIKPYGLHPLLMSMGRLQATSCSEPSNVVSRRLSWAGVLLGDAMPGPTSFSFKPLETPQGPASS